MTTQCPQCLANLPPRAKLCARCGNTVPIVAEEAARAPSPPAPREPDVATSRVSERALAAGAAAFGAIALLVVLVYASC